MYRHNDFAHFIQHKPRKTVLKNVYPTPIKAVFYFQEEPPLYHVLCTIKWTVLSSCECVLLAHVQHPHPHHRRHCMSTKHMKSGVPVAKRWSLQDMDFTSKRQRCLNTETNQPEWSCSFNKQWWTGTRLAELDTGALFKHLVTRLGDEQHAMSKKLFYNCIWWSCPTVVLFLTPFDAMYLRIY